MPLRAVAFGFSSAPGAPSIVPLARCRIRLKRTMPSTPSIRISADPRRSSPTGYTPFPPSVAPMAIPRAREIPPPPLPPPTYIPDILPGQDPGWAWGNDPNGVDFGRPASVKAGSSLLGSGPKVMRSLKEQDSAMHYRFNDARRGSSISTITAGQDQDQMEDASQYSDEDPPSIIRPTSNRYAFP